MSMAIIGAIAGLGLQSSQGLASRHAGEDAADSQTAINRLRNDQARKKFIRSFRQAQANDIQAGINAGVGIDSSRVRGAVSSTGSQKRQQLKEFGELDRLGAEVIQAEQRSVDANQKAQVGGAIASFASQFINFSGGSSSPPPGE